MNFSCHVTDDVIVESFLKVKAMIVHTDAPTESDICLIRDNLGIPNANMLSLFWLRNRVVQLRKSGKLSVKAKSSEGMLL